MALKGRGGLCQAIFFDGAHQVDAATRTVVFIAGDYVRRAGFETQTAMHAGKDLLFFCGKCGCKL